MLDWNGEDGAIEFTVRTKVSINPSVSGFDGNREE